MQGFVEFTNRSQGRERIFRATQYTCMLLSYVVERHADNKKLVLKLKQLESSMSSGRKRGRGTMTAKKNQPLQNGRAKENVLQRILQLPVVSSTCESLQRTYSSTKEIHPIVASVCGVYEQGVKGASALAMWSVEPVVRRLEPQFSVANNLACRGLDHLEEKIPALQYPVEKLASKLKDTISTPIQSAKSTIGYSMDKILGLAVGGYETTRTTVETTARYTRSNSVSQMAAAGMDTALGGLEKLMEYLLPEEEEEADLKPKKTCRPAKVSQQQSRTYRAPSAPSSAPSTLGRIGALVSTASHRAYQHTVQNLQRAKAKGQELVVWIPILVSPSLSQSLGAWNSPQALVSVPPAGQSGQAEPTYGAAEPW
ncbi:peroxisomal membrane protein 11A isoform X1 [Centrocercus urophasianus]|uniref:peroxisomal membrane protein 11A isoform X1 n=1 Tax=Centrocercus urophasianus TaxID=9002 RepID=UPI001C652452|nr:peroxisomal membrane protein 11A isoform X1 [Centrocercus urophasianus]